MTYALYAGTDNGLPTGQAYVSGERDARGTVSILTGAWTHLATTYDGTSLKLYVNGTLVKTQSASGTMTVSNGVLKIGGNGIWGEWYRGLIDDVRIYSRSLTPSEIQSDMNLPVF